MRALLVAVLVLGTFNPSFGGEPGTAEFPGPATELGPQVDQCVQAAMVAHDMVGVAAAVVVDGELAYEAGYGLKHRDLGGAVDAHTRFAHGSTGKMHTAAAVLRLVDQGLVDLSDPVTEYVPELHFAPGPWTADQMTVRHLITNSAAVPSFRSAMDVSLSEWADTLAELPLLAKPGTFFNYSNSNLALAGLVVERASGMSFMEYLDTEVFAVAGMADCSADPDAVMASGNYSHGHADDGQIYAPEDFGYPNEVASGNAFSSAHDLAAWARLMMAGGGEVISPAATARLQQRQVPRYYDTFGLPPSIDGGFYGFGLFIDDYPEAAVSWHSGGVPGYVGMLAWVRNDGFSVALLANTWPSGSTAIEEVFECIADSALGLSLPDMSEHSDSATWGRHTGTYDAVFEDGYDFEVVIERQGDALLMTAPNPMDPNVLITRELENTAGSRFLFRIDPQNWWPVTFIAGPGDPSPFRWIRNGRFAGLKRVDPRQIHGRRVP